METRSGKTSATFLLNGRSSDFVLDCLHHNKWITNPLIKSAIKPSSKTYIKYVQFLEYTSTYRVEKLKFALTMLEDPGYLQHIWPVLKKKITHIKSTTHLCVLMNVWQTVKMFRMYSSQIKTYSYICLLLAGNEVLRGIRQPRWFLICKQSPWLLIKSGFYYSPALYTKWAPLVWGPRSEGQRWWR